MSICGSTVSDLAQEGFDRLHRDASTLLGRWLPPDDDQASLRAAYLAFLEQHGNAMERACTIGHLTASALVMDEARSRVLLTLHPKVGRWLQLGGHCEAPDRTMREAALRESREESGIEDVVISEWPLRLDRHPVPCAGGQSEHLDVQFLATVPSDAVAVISHESDDLQWFGVDALPEGLDASVRALVAAALSGEHRPIAG